MQLLTFSSNRSRFSCMTTLTVATKDEALTAARKVFGSADTAVIRYDAENWPEIRLRLFWDYENKTPFPGNLLLRTGGNFIVPVHEGDWLVYIRGGGYVHSDCGFYVGRVNEEIINALK